MAEDIKNKKTLTFYVVRSKDGKYLRSKGYSGSGESWVDSLLKAKVWTKIGSANAQVTWWTSNYPKYGIPDVIPLTATLGEPLNQDERVRKALKKKNLAKAERDLYPLQEKFDKAKREHERHGSEYSKKRYDEAKERMEIAEAIIYEIKNS